MFICRNFAERDVAVSYYKSLAYEDPGKELQVTKRYEEEYMKVIMESFRSCALELSEAVFDNKRLMHSMGKIPAPFCAVLYTSDLRYPSDDEKSRECRRPSPRGENVALKYAAPKTKAEYRK